MQHIKYFLNRLSLKGKLNLFQGTVAVGMLLIFVASWWGITMLSRTAEIRKQIFEDEFLALKLKNETEQWSVLTYGYLYRKNPEHLKDHKILGKRVKKQADALIKKEIIFFKSSLFGVSGADENMVAETNRLFSQRDEELKKIFKDLDKLLELGGYMAGKSSGQTDVSAYENLFIHHRMAFNQGIDKWMKSLIKTSADVSKAGALMQKEVLTWVLFWIIALQISLFVLGRNTVFAVTGGLDYLRKIGQRIAGGDLRIQSRVRAKNDEIGTVIEVFGTMTESLKDIVAKIQGVGGKLVNSSDNLSTVAEDISESTQKTASSINQVASGVSEQSRSASDAASLVEQIALAIDQVAKGAQDQAREINETHNSVAELSEAVTQVSQSANHVSTTVKESSEIAGKGEEAVAETISGMNRIKEVVEESAHKIEALGEKSQQIGDIVEVIDDIAEQTNLLALNAAIEAARAGEHGKGFAVVAEEVRKLAERSTNATKEIANLIQSIQHEMIDAVKAMQTGTEEVEKGSQLADKAGASLREIINSVELVVNQIKDVSSATERMTHLAQNTTKAIDNIAAVTEENTASTQEVAASTDQVVQSITTIAAISEETAASAQSVSAFTESQASKVQEMAVSAQELALLAEDLRLSVTHFVIEDSEGTRSGNSSETILKKLDTPCDEKEDQALLSGKKIS